MQTAHDLVAAARGRIREVPLDQAEQAVRDADLVLDVREPDEFAIGHIPGAVLIPRGLLEFKLSATPELAERGLRVVLYCKTGGRAALAASTMLAMGYTQVASIAGGYDAWVGAGMPVARAALPSFD